MNARVLALWVFAGLVEGLLPLLVQLSGGDDRVRMIRRRQLGCRRELSRTADIPEHRQYNAKSDNAPAHKRLPR